MRNATQREHGEWIADLLKRMDAVEEVAGELANMMGILPTEPVAIAPHQCDFVFPDGRRCRLRPHAGKHSMEPDPRCPDCAEPVSEGALRCPRGHAIPVEKESNLCGKCAIEPACSLKPASLVTGCTEYSPRIGKKCVDTACIEKWDGEHWHCPADCAQVWYTDTVNHYLGLIDEHDPRPTPLKESDDAG